jgi:hypothetical protein
MAATKGDSNVRRSTVLRAAGVVGAAGVVAYAWWATGLQPFTTSAYVAVGLPVAGLAVVAVVGRPGSRFAGGAAVDARGVGRLQLRSTFPWVVLLLLAVGLEVAGLALGGRSAEVPTLSTVIDHALGWHGVRLALFLGWLAVGWAPVARVAVHRRARAA